MTIITKIGRERTSQSKFLSLVLRHKPELLNLTLSDGGWVEVNRLLHEMQKQGKNLSRKELAQIVAENPKQRFTLSPDKVLIRANQGHSVPVNLALEAIEPPEHLYHGTAQKTIELIEKQGIRKQKRHHVHLSADRDTASEVGRRLGKPAIFRIKAMAMYKAGYSFYQTENKVWLTDYVPLGFFLLEK